MAQSHGFAGVDRFLFRGKDAEEAQNPNHLEGLRGKGGGVDELGIATELSRTSKRIDDCADARGIDEWHLLQIKNEVDTAIRKCGFERGRRIPEHWRT